MKAKLFAMIFFVTVSVLVLPVTNAAASQVMAEDTGKECGYCHKGTPEELEFTDAGEQFIANDYHIPTGGFLADKLLKKFRRLLISLHAVSAFALLGGLFYLQYTAPGLLVTRDITLRERHYFVLSASVAGVTGAVMVPLLIKGSEFWMQPLGFLIGIKAILYLAVVAVAFRLLHLGKVAADKRSLGTDAEDALAKISKEFSTTLSVGASIGLILVVITALWHLE